MIDAYEIGIQLMLQDDVTAGLAVINRGLAEVDRAIAATSAKLAGLGREEEIKTKAASAASGTRESPARANNQTATTTAEQAGEAQSNQERRSAPAFISGEKPTAPEMKGGEPVAPVRPPPLSPNAENILSDRKTRDVLVAASAPVASAIGETFSHNQQTNLEQNESPATPINAPAQPESAPSDSSIPLETAPSKTASARQEARRSAPNPPNQVAITASVKRHEAALEKGARQNRAEYQPMKGPELRRERAVAPWSGISDYGMRGEQKRLPDGAAAPTSAEQHQNAPGGGTVMLDGRLVGQWLSEHMAREASRPPAGTSFFDPRQTPAWNVSGAL